MNDDERAADAESRRIRRVREESEAVDPTEPPTSADFPTVVVPWRLRRPTMKTTGRTFAAGVAVLSIVIAAVTVAAAFAKVGADTARGVEEARAYSPPALMTAGQSAPTVVVVGDQSVVSAAPSVSTGERWTQLVADELQVRVRTVGSRGAGFTVRGADRRTFQQMIADVPSDADVVMLFGGAAADADATAASITSAATGAVAAAQVAAPDAKVVVVGPVVADGATTTALGALRTALQSAAETAGVQFIDPVRANWLSADVVAGADGGALSVDQERQIANRVDALLPTVLG